MPLWDPIWGNLSGEYPGGALRLWRSRYAAAPAGHTSAMRRNFLPWHHHPGHPAVAVPMRVDPTGRHGPTPKAVRCGRWRRVGPGWFVPADVDSSHVDQRIVEAAVHLGPYGAVTGWAALHWSGGRWFGGQDRGAERPVVLATGDAGIRAAPGLLVSEEQLLPADIVVVDGLRVTTPVRSVLYEMRYATGGLGALTALDMACHSDLVSVEEAAGYAATLGTWTGIPRARGVVSLADENAWSPTEVAMRWIWECDAGLPRPLTNVAVFDRDGRHLITPDLIDAEAGVVGEYDGAGHLDRRVKERDVRRDDLCRRLGLEQATMTAPDLGDPGSAIMRLRGAYARAGATPQADRVWSISPPAWWKPTRTVAQRRALAAHERSRFLRYREAG